MPAAVGVLAVVGSIRTPVLVGFGLSLVTIALIAVGAVPFGTSVTAVLAMIGGVLLATFAGLSRRQFRQSESQAAELRERALAMREEASRVAIARDLHDVLAHSLGGLVIQLDAVEALLESGDVREAGKRVTDARGLAASGLSEARRAVAALRDPAGAPAGVPVEPDTFAASLAELLAAHRSLGAVADLTIAGEPVPLADAQATAVQRALQQALSNARKHAPGEPIRVALDGWPPREGRMAGCVSPSPIRSPTARIRRWARPAAVTVSTGCASVRRPPARRHGLGRRSGRPVRRDRGGRAVSARPDGAGPGGAETGMEPSRSSGWWSPTIRRSSATVW